MTDSLPPLENVVGWGMEAMQKRQWRVAIERWNVLRRLYPNDVAVWIQLSIAHRQLEGYEESERFLREAWERFPLNASVLAQWSDLDVDRGEFASALERLRMLRDNFPKNIVGWARAADVLERLGRHDEAVTMNRHAREYCPDHPWPWVQYAEMAMKACDWSAALERWADVRSRFPDHAKGYVRAAEAAEAAEAMGQVRYARQLKLAQEYGNDWLEKESNQEGSVSEVINPPSRRTVRMFWDLVWTKARLNLKSEASQNHLRYLWWILDPLLYMTVFYVVFGLLMERGGPGFIAYLLTGLVPFQWFAKTVQHTSNSIVGGKGLMHKVRISPLFFPLVGIVQNTGKQLLVFAMLAIFLILYGLPPTIHWLAFIPVVLVQLLLMAVVSCLLAMIVPFVRDLTNLIPTGIQFLLFTSGIFYNIERIPEEWRSLFFLNPMANILYQYRLVLVENQWPDWSGLGWVALGCGLGLVVVVFLYRRFEPIFPRVVIE
ncbi:ABC transporter permease [Halomonas sp. I1]|uniref:ABC transporter permease n=1 Tax=Halomonas sp. I1 TaxID=393536 RepID=UPI0028DE68FA|nr:ABC transporter permease [Halomonas sp. I1]MDT8894596.1 ABC transporter permease [Halomonas sp. I1]